MRKIFALVFLLDFCLPSSNSAFYLKNDNDCPSNCNCSEIRINCVGFIPYTIPATTDEVVLSQVRLDQLIPDIFCYVHWKHVTNLIIASVNSNELFALSDGVFDCLNFLRVFKFSGEFFQHFSQKTFSGLSNVSVFDLSGCRHIDWEDFNKTFSIFTNFPKLKYLILSKAGILGDILILDQVLIRFISTRPVLYIDLSYTDVAFDFDTHGHLCHTLNYLSVAGAQLRYSTTFGHSGPCRSLQTFENSDDRNFRSDFKDVKCINKSLHLLLKVRFFDTIKIARYNHIITKYENFETLNCTLFLFTPLRYLKEFYFSANFLPNFDLILINDRLELIDLSRNEIENINPNAFENMSSLLELYLANNFLSKTNLFETTFSVLFKHNLNLNLIDLSGNQLAYLPMETFITNVRIMKLNLSVNSLSQITFNVSHLLRLTVLDLRFNSVVSLNKNSRQMLDNLYDNQKQQYNTTNNYRLVKVLLDGNPFSCGCDSLEFLEWFAATQIFSSTRLNYYCKLDGKQYQMNEAAVDASKEHCKEIKRKHLIMILLSVLLPFSVSAAIMFFIFLRKRHKRKMIEQKFKDGLQRLREDTSRFPVFLSYSSEDNEFVKLHILQQLQDQLELRMELNRDLVCIADTQFIPGHTILSEIFRCLNKSDVVIAVMTKNYCTSRFCRFEIENAHLLKKPIILIFAEYVEEDEMSLVIKEIFETFTRVQFVFEDGQYRIQPDWSHICESIVGLM